MLTTRVIPCLDVKNGRTVKGIQFEDLRDAGDPAELAAKYDREGADEICFLDITASHEGRGALLEAVARAANQCFTPLTVGGGVGSPEDVNDLLRAGADKISINSAAVRNPDLLTLCAQKFGSQCIVAAVDAKREGENNWGIYTHGGRKPTGIDAVEYAKLAEAKGAGEILLTSMDSDGEQSGYDIALLQAVTQAVSIPVIASGGAGSAEDMVKAAKDGNASAVLAASIFHFGRYSIKQVKEALNIAGLPARL